MLIRITVTFPGIHPGNWLDLPVAPETSIPSAWYLSKPQGRKGRSAKNGAEEGLIQIVPVDVSITLHYTAIISATSWAFQDQAWNGFVDHRQPQNRGTYICLIVFLCVFADVCKVTLGSDVFCIGVPLCNQLWNLYELCMIICDPNQLHLRGIHPPSRPARAEALMLKWPVLITVLNPMWGSGIEHDRSQHTRTTYAPSKTCSIKDKQHCRCTLQEWRFKTLSQKLMQEP